MTGTTVVTYAVALAQMVAELSIRPAAPRAEMMPTKDINWYVSDANSARDPVSLVTAIPGRDYPRIIQHVVTN